MATLDRGLAVLRGLTVRRGGRRLRRSCQRNPRVPQMDVPERYVWLCLQVGRHIEDFIDGFVGPRTWERSVAAEEIVDPKHLRDEAMVLLEGLARADLEEDRRYWLRGQLEALACITARLSGDDIAWTDEVQRCLGVRPTITDASVLEDVHRRLDAPTSTARRTRSSSQSIGSSAKARLSG